MENMEGPKSELDDMILNIFDPQISDKDMLEIMNTKLDHYYDNGNLKYMDDEFTKFFEILKDHRSNLYSELKESDLIYWKAYINKLENK